MVIYMTKDVLVSVKGLQFADVDIRETASDEELDSIETICPGQYFFRNEGHFIVYEELVDGFAGVIKNMIKLRDREFVISKKGPVNVQMVFSEGKKRWQIIILLLEILWLHLTRKRSKRKKRKTI